MFLTGCTALTVDQSVQTAPETKAVEYSYALCKNKVDSIPEAMRLSEYFVLGKNKKGQYLEKITDDSYATDEQISDIDTYHGSLKICRDKAVDDLQTFNMDYAMIVSAYFSKDDKITADVVSKKITIGEANRRVTESEYYFGLGEYGLKKRNESVR